MSGVDDVVRAIGDGGLVVLPTDTVYGLVCAASSRHSAADLYRLKGRSEIQPTALVFASVGELLRCVPELQGEPAEIAGALLPGPFTLVVPNPARRFGWLTEGRPDTIGVRVPLLSGPTAEILDRVGAVAATSANLAGGSDPRRLDEVPLRIRAGVAASVDGGELPGIPSTVIDLTGPEPVILRPGAAGPGECSGADRYAAYTILTSPRPCAYPGGIASGRMLSRITVIVAGAAVALGLGVPGAAAATPTAITGAVSAVGGTSATLNGTVNPAGAATEWWFEYGTSVAYGSKTTTAAAGSGSTNVAVPKALSGLAPATTYHYRLVARNASGTTNGGDGIFTTASPPVAVTAPATGVGPSTATLRGTVNPNGQPTTWYVEYGTSTSYGTKTAVVDAGSGTASKAVSVAVTGLTAGRTYHFRLVASSSAGTSPGSDTTFVTAAPPTVTTSAAGSIGSTGARLNGKVGPNGRATTYFFDYGTTTAYGAKTSSSSAGSGSSVVNVSKTLSGLKAGTTYHFRLVASSDAGTVTGADQVFTTQAAPSVTIVPAAAVGPTTATLGGTVNPNGRSTSWYVEYGTSTSYGSRSSSRSAGSGTTPLAVLATISSLRAGVTYHFRLVAANPLGTTRSTDSTFVTTGAPLAATGPVNLATLSLTHARVNGTINPRGLATTWWFEYGRTRGYGFRTVEAATSGSADARVSAMLSGLTPGVRWHYRLVARSAAGTTSGADASFATPPRPLDPSRRPVRCTIVGTQAADVLRGTRGRDVICGLGGNDRILGGGGADVVYGGPGVDSLDGGIGNDVLRGGAGNDEAFGRSGNDRLEGGAGADRLDGGTGRDSLVGGPAADVLLARDGRSDFLDGGGGPDLGVADRALDRLVSIERRRFVSP